MADFFWWRSFGICHGRFGGNSRLIRLQGIFRKTGFGATECINNAAIPQADHDAGNIHFPFMLFGVLLYFSVAVLALAWICLPAVRHRAREETTGLLRRGNALGTAWRMSGAKHLSRRQAGMRDAARDAGRFARRHAGGLAAAVAVIVGLPVGALLLRDIYRVDSFDANASRQVDERVAQLLRGEELVPPPPLPPEFFTTAEVEAWQPLARNASRQWDLLDDAFRQRLLLVFRLVREKYGYDMVLIEGYRSPQRQASLAALGPSVTRAGPFESYHQLGLAADCAFLRNGRIVISEKDPWAMAGYSHYGEIAKSVGLVWGGDWRNLRDLGHVELRRPRAGAPAVDNPAR
jgi:peptidoglycan L-alanyl-D-glutamate endopeptidase CwlK